ncbi:3-demethylubiquinone-9 3-methyltransferase [Thalassospira xiamenensis]|uniref:class I SAM-dependent methyltransferase n=1 Tax=Thalassospira xiamenensis TaxID=220697 RepID=UPI000DEDEE77|nr:class I SAM-dependent methyltransferase [Thalassospira xiamenensis]RCK34076.1 3-demethylubiquinone-9 3-methyltransferase [Thalassospira xiamenensis]
MSIDLNYIDGYAWKDASNEAAHDYIMPTVIKILSNYASGKNKRLRIFDLGCGNGAAAKQLSEIGYDICGVDPSKEGISIANQNLSHLKLFQGSAYDDLASQYGTFDAVISLEVVEHVYAPRLYAKTLHSLVNEKGCAIISTPYHGYWKNLAIAIIGGYDKHFTALWDHGHIKFWSINTLRKLLQEAGFENIKFIRVGRIPILAKSMIVICQK